MITLGNQKEKQASGGSYSELSPVMKQVKSNTEPLAATPFKVVRLGQ